MTGILHVGCYTSESGGAGEGITAVRRDPGSGELTVIGLAAPAASPSFLAWHPALPVLYAVNELDDGRLTAWSAGPDGATLRPLGSASTGGAAPCHLAVAPDGAHVLVANYATGSIAVFPLDATGAPGERSDLVEHEGRGIDPDRQERAHAHFVAIGAGSATAIGAGSATGGATGAAGTPALAVDLGIDAVRAYALDAATGRLAAAGDLVRARPGTGPRHVAAHGGRRYVVGELDASLTAYDVGAAGEWRESARVASTEGGESALPSEVAVSADGRLVYVANRGSDTLAVFATDGDAPRRIAEIPTGGAWPRHFTIIDGWLYVANERSHTITGLPLDFDGVPGPARTTVSTPSPTCVLARP